MNGRFFVHHVTLGLHPRMIRIRERLNYGSRLGQDMREHAGVVDGVQAAAAPRRPIRADGELLQRRTAAILVSNNPLGEGHLPYADDLRQGKLGLYVTTSRRWQDLLQLTARMTLGEISDNPLLEQRQAEEIDIELHRPGRERLGRRRDRSARDAAPAHRARSGLKVLRPAPEQASAEGRRRRPGARTRFQRTGAWRRAERRASVRMHRRVRDVT